MQWNRLAELSAAEWLLLGQLLPAAGIITLAVRYSNPLKWAGAGGAKSGGKRLPLGLRHVDDDRLYLLADWASRASAGRRRCLVRSVLLRWLLNRKGYSDAVVEIGVDQRQGEFLSHAWVSVADRKIGEPATAAEGFRTIARITSR